MPTKLPATTAPAPGSGQPGARRFRRLRPLIAAAACLCLAVALIPAMRTMLPSLTVSPDSDASPALSAGASGLYQYSSYEELDRQVRTLLDQQAGSAGPDVMFYAQDELAAGGMSEDAEESIASDSDEAAPAMNAAGPSAKAAGRTSQTPDHSETYTQVEDIDEADIVKTDGTYIYYLSSIENQIIIAKAAEGKAKRVSAVGGSGDRNRVSYINDIYVQGDRLLVLASARGLQTDKASSDMGADRLDPLSTLVTVYDISDRTAPKEETRYLQTGSLLSSRLVDGRLVLVTSDAIYPSREDHNAPYVCYGSGPAEKLPIGDIAGFPQVCAPTFTVIGMMDPAGGKASRDTVKTRAVLGGSDQIYCSGERLYLTGTVYDQAPGAGSSGLIGRLLPGSADRTGAVYDPDAHQPRTQILRISLEDGKVDYEKSAIVAGTVDSQFSMDERKGYFRIATTSRHQGQDVNNLYILDRRMEQAGQCTGFARDEHIEAVRYIKDKAYVITYRQTDPLFIIDLSDPSNPVIEGHVKISGFSTLLVPAGDDHLLGLGFSTEDTGIGEATNGVKLALFDISDPSAPKVADSLAFPDMSSPVQFDHKALMAGPDADGFAVPYEVVKYSWDDTVDLIEDAENLSEEPEAAGESGSDEDSLRLDEGSGILVFSAKAGRLRILQELRTEESVRRCIYIGDWIYGICGDDSIEGFRMQH